MYGRYSPALRYERNEHKISRKERHGVDGQSHNSSMDMTGRRFSNNGKAADGTVKCTSI